MSDLLIHSMSEFAGTILGCLKAAGARRIVEVGAKAGGMSERLADHARTAGGELVSIDPVSGVTCLGQTATIPQVGASGLEAMRALAGVDAWVIDGDHNYYTVVRELQIADDLSRRDGRPLLAFIHQVAWPCARRDQYRAPESIPAGHRHPYSRDVGVTLDSEGALPNRGFRGPGRSAFALKAGGPQNGVLTAVEDFLVGARADGRELAFALIPAVFGLGVVFAADAPWSSEVASILLPLHDNPLIARLEENRLRNYLAVIDRQDRRYPGVAAA